VCEVQIQSYTQFTVQPRTRAETIASVVLFNEVFEESRWGKRSPGETPAGQERGTGGGKKKKEREKRLMGLLLFKV